MRHIEYGVRHYAHQGIDHEFDTLHEAIEWVTEREEPDEWRLYQREITDWEEVE